MKQLDVEVSTPANLTSPVICPDLTEQLELLFEVFTRLDFIKTGTLRILACYKAKSATSGHSGLYSS